MWRRLRFLILRRKKDFAIHIRRRCFGLCRKDGFVPVSGSQPYGKGIFRRAVRMRRGELADGACGKEVEYTGLRGRQVRCRKAV